VTEPTVPTKTGYTFGGWYKESGCTNTWDFNTDTVISDVTLYAKWTTANYTYTVTYSGNGSTGGTVPVDPSSPYEYGATVTVLGNTGSLVKTGYTFDGWNTQADGFGTDRAVGSEFTMGADDVTLYAQWTPLYALRDIGPAGGRIFYVKADGYSDGWMYMEAAPQSTETSKEWGSYGTFIGRTETGIGTGQSNTTIIVAWLNNHSETNRAAQFCDDLVVGSGWAFLPNFDDWFLPSKDELNLMYQNLKVAGVGDFAGYGYWGSSEGSAACFAWLQSFVDGGQGSYPKYSPARVRAVRAF